MALMDSPRAHSANTGRKGRDFIARHGETVYNIAGRMQGDHPHTPLTRAGFMQAEHMGAAFRALLGHKPRVTLWASPTGRALQTLAVVAEDRFAGKPGVTIVEGALPEGVAAHAPFDLIFCDGSVATGLDRLTDQLAEGGRLVAIAGEGRSTKATVFRRAGDGVAASTSFDAFGPALPGFERAETFAF